MNQKIYKIVGVLAVIILVSFASAKFFANKNATPQKQETLKERVINAGKIRVGYLATTSQQLAKDPNTGQLSGMFYDVVEEAGKKLNLKIEWTEEVGWGTMIEGLNQGRYDMVGSPVWANGARALKADFSTPVTYNVMYAYARADDNRLNKLEDINSQDIKVTVVDGTTAQYLTKQRFSDAQVVALPQLSAQSDLLLNVSTKKADVLFIDPFVANTFMKNNPDAKFKIVENKIVRVDGNSIMFNSNETGFKNMLDTVLKEEINSGFIDELLKKYDTFGNSFYPVATPYSIQ
ncbi:MAG: transporter substrate-binding domain-containing protein [Candidatus Moranbacteria bacterium]|nr:transporter substrate-binding domain-containing protein [Candidatus Moranbacteria bacterium]